MDYMEIMEVILDANEDYREKTRNMPFELRVGAACMLIELAAKDAGKPISEVIGMVSNVMTQINETYGEI